MHCVFLLACRDFGWTRKRDCGAVTEALSLYPPRGLAAREEHPNWILHSPEAFKGSAESSIILHSDAPGYSSGVGGLIQQCMSSRGLFYIFAVAFRCLCYTYNMSTVAAVKTALQIQADPKRALISQRFFKTGKGEYGEGDRFIGVTVPQQRQIARQFWDLSLPHVRILLGSMVHEHRLTGWLIILEQMRRADEVQQSTLARFTIANMDYMNNWDLVDTAAPKILGPYFFGRSRKQLFVWARSPRLWRRRVAVLTTHYFITQNDFSDTVQLAELLLNDTHDLMHKAVGWMLREVGKRDRAVLLGFLDAQAAAMPRTMLRYAIEHLPSAQRKAYLKMA